MTDISLRPGKFLSAYGRLYPEAWKQVDELRARRKELRDWPEWCFLPLTGIHTIATKGKDPQSIHAHHVGILGALAAWRVTQGIYRFDSTAFNALWKTPVTGEIPNEVLFHLPEWCVYIPTPDQTWQGSNLNGFFAHLEYGMSDRRTELRLVLDVTGPAGDQLVIMPIPLGKSGVAEGVQAAQKETDRQFPVTVYSSDGVAERLSSDISPLVSLVLYLCTKAAEIKEIGDGKREPAFPKPQKTKKGMRIFGPDHPSHWDVGYRLGSTLRQALAEQEPWEPTETKPSPPPQVQRADGQSSWVVKQDQPDGQSVTLEWLPPIPANA